LRGVDRRVLDHLLTQDERDAFEGAGYLIVRDALPDSVVETLLARAYEEDLLFRAQPDVGEYHILNLHDLISRRGEWLSLIDCPTTFGKVFGILGWHIQLFHTQLLVTPPAPAGSTAGAYGWHQDNNRMNLDLETSPQPRVSVKVGYFLTDLPEPGMGNLAVVPGSHRRGRPDLAPGAMPDGAVEVLARRRDAIIFDRRLWHAASVNRSTATRVFVTYGYSYRWLRPKSAMQHDELFGRLDPVGRQLLGWSTSANGYFDPTEEDVPLREWIRTNVGEGALQP
jgi:Phytanoyl-CoA dioxygenase (PhyH)